jgi:hypothetical protein
MNLRSGLGDVGSGHGSTGAEAGRDPEDHGDNGRENANGESHGPHSWVPLRHHYLR